VTKMSDEPPLALNEAIAAAQRKSDSEQRGYGESVMILIENSGGLAAAVASIVGADALEEFANDLRWVAKSHGWEYK